MKHTILLLYFDVKGLIPHALNLDCVNVSPLLEGPHSLSGRDLSENLKLELQFRRTHKTMQAVSWLQMIYHFLFR